MTQHKYSIGDPVVWIADDPAASFEWVGADSTPPPGVLKGTRGTYDDPSGDSIVPWIRMEDGSRVVASVSKIAPTSKTYTLAELRDALPSLPMEAEIRDSEGDLLSRDTVEFLDGVWAPYMVTFPPEPAPETEIVVVSGLGRLKVGDVVVKEDDSQDWPHVRRAKPVPQPKRDPGTAGTATVNGVAGVRGTWGVLFSGDPYYMLHDGNALGRLSATVEHVTNFVPDEN